MSVIALYLRQHVRHKCNVHVTLCGTPAHVAL